MLISVNRPVRRHIDRLLACSRSGFKAPMIGDNSRVSVEMSRRIPLSSRTEKPITGICSSASRSGSSPFGGQIAVNRKWSSHCRRSSTASIECSPPFSDENSNRIATCSIDAVQMWPHLMFGRMDFFMRHSVQMWRKPGQAATEGAASFLAPPFTEGDIEFAAVALTTPQASVRPSASPDRQETCPQLEQF